MSHHQIFHKHEIRKFKQLTRQEYLNHPVLRKFKYLPRISYAQEYSSVHERDRRLLDTSNPNNWKITKSRGYLTARGAIETFDILEKLGSSKMGRLILCLNNPFVAFLDLLGTKKLKNQKILIINPGITQKVIDQNNEILSEVYPGKPKIIDPKDAIMSAKNKELLEKSKAIPSFWDHRIEGNNPGQKFKENLASNRYSGLILNGGSLPTTADWLVKHWGTIHEYLEENPNSWCALLCAPIYILNPGKLSPVYECDIYDVPQGSLKLGFGYFGSGIAVNPHFKSRKKLGSMSSYYHKNNSIVVDIPDKGIFIY